MGAGTEYVFRGISQTMESPAIQASMDIELGSGLYAYAWASNVDFVPDGGPDDGASYEIDLAVGYFAEIGNDWSVDAALIRYLFPDTSAGVDYDYNELMVTLDHAGKLNATVAYTRNVDGTNAASLFYRVGASFDLAWDAGLSFSYGYVDLTEAYGAAYAYSEATFSRGFGNMTIMLSGFDTHGSAELIYGQRITGPRVVLALQLDW